MLTDEAQEDLAGEAKAQERQRLNMSNDVTLNLLAPLFTDLQLSLTHNLALALWAWTNNAEADPEIDEFTWDEDHVTSHQIGASFTLPLFENVLRQQVTATYVLPPLDESLKLDYSLTTDPFRTSLRYNLKRKEEDDESLTPIDLLWDITLTPLEELSLRTSFLWSLDPEPSADQFNINLKAYWYNGRLDFRKRRLLMLNEARTAWLQDDSEEFILSSMEHRLDIPISTIKGEPVEFNSTINARWNHDFIQFTSSSLSFGATFDILFTGFLLFRLSVNSVNDHIYRYIPDYSSQLGLENVDFFEDLFKSFNFFDIAEREESGFKLTIYFIRSAP